VDPLLRDVRLDPGRIPDPNAFPFALPAVRALEQPLGFHPQVTFLVGENGSGKSTILEALATKLDLDAEGGDTVMTFVEHSADTPLHEALVLARGPRSPSMRYFLRAESFFNVARHVDAHEQALKAHGGQALHEMSHGESFLTLVLERFYPDGLFLLDEPEAARSRVRSSWSPRTRRCCSPTRTRRSTSSASAASTRSPTRRPTTTA
jgi:predicted ATPase